MCVSRSHRVESFHKSILTQFEMMMRILNDENLIFTKSRKLNRISSIWRRRCVFTHQHQKCLNLGSLGLIRGGDTQSQKFDIIMSDIQESESPPNHLLVKFTNYLRESAL